VTSESGEKGDAHEPGAIGIGNREAHVLLVLMLGVFTALKVSLIEPSISDENIYFYMGKLLSDGALPYRDFRFAHPPIKLLPPALVFAVAGFSFTALKLLPILIANATAAFLFLLARRVLGTIGGLTAAGLFLFSFAGLYYTSFYMGTGLTVAFVAAGLWFLDRRNDAACGVLLALACLTGVYAGCAVAAVGVFLLATERGRLRAYGTGFFAVWLPANVLLGIWLGINPVLLGLTLLYPFFRDLRLHAAWGTGVVFLAAIAAYASVHQYYFLLAAPFLAVAGAAVATGVARRVRLSPAGTTLILAAGVALLATVSLPNARRGVASGTLTQASEMVTTIEEMAPGGRTLFGQAEVAPLMALMSGREILANEVDTNGKVYLSGMADLDGIREAILASPGIVLIAKERLVEGDGEGAIFYGPLVDEKFREFVHRTFDIGFPWVHVDNPNDRILFLARRFPQ
jgi:hypothetical protein